MWQFPAVPVTLVFSLCCAFSAAQPLRAWSAHPADNASSRALQSFADSVRDASNGRIAITAYNNSELGDQPQAIQKLARGDIEFGVFNLGPLSGVVPQARLLTLPFVFPDSDHMFRKLDEGLGARIGASLFDKGFKVLAWYDGGSRSFYCMNHVVRYPSDFAGLRVRVQDSPVYNDMVRQLGATPVVVPFNDISKAFQDGRIDCAENNIPSYVETGNYKYARNVLLTNHIVTPEVLVVSRRYWQTLSPTDQSTLQSLGAQSGTVMRTLWKQQLTGAEQTLHKAGITPVLVKDPGVFVARMIQVYASTLQGQDEFNQVLPAMMK
ncbi:TRAP transporter substrate-binding protein DctP [Silvimonas iriomotensis]|uniref:C4-dicarboxylate ABC transporter n=1 Tax=Silvimonas iriomotensis TaxID=449662 RepID=A0ABQ2PA64_9NEIS|nr:TRAP transporter substrate-binding protein DctP [Silvimonas iriomotensis]GGP22069.1 C4-dicarboxylate ABC transporter [Silvimonas iriomotensis]